MVCVGCNEFFAKGSHNFWKLGHVGHKQPTKPKYILSPDEFAVLQSQSTVQELNSPHQLESHCTIDHTQQPTSPAPTPSISRPTRKRNNSNENRLEETYEDIHATKNTILSRDEFDVYRQYVSTELRALNDEHGVIMAKYYINNILLE